MTASVPATHELPRSRWTPSLALGRSHGDVQA